MLVLRSLLSLSRGRSSCLCLLLGLLSAQELSILVRAIGNRRLTWITCCGVHCRLCKGVVAGLQHLPGHLPNHVLGGIWMGLTDVILNVLELGDVSLMSLLGKACIRPRRSRRHVKTRAGRRHSLPVSIERGHESLGIGLVTLLVQAVYSRGSHGWRRVLQARVPLLHGMRLPLLILHLHGLSLLFRNALGLRHQL